MSAVILYVDSDVGSRRTHKLLLESAGYQVLTAETVAEAYRIFSSARTRPAKPCEHGAGIPLKIRVRGLGLGGGAGSLPAVGK